MRKFLIAIPALLFMALLTAQADAVETLVCRANEIVVEGKCVPAAMERGGGCLCNDCILSDGTFYRCMKCCKNPGARTSGIPNLTQEGYLKVDNVVVDNTGGTPLPANYKFPIWLSCSNFAPNVWLPVPLAGGAFSTNDPAFGPPTSPPSRAGIACTVTQNIGAALPLGSNPLSKVPSQACHGPAYWTTTYSPRSGPYTGAVQIPANGTATVTVTNSLSCAPPSAAAGTTRTQADTDALNKTAAAVADRIQASPSESVALLVAVRSRNETSVKEILLRNGFASRDLEGVTFVLTDQTGASEVQAAPKKVRISAKCCPPQLVIIIRL